MDYKKLNFEDGNILTAAQMNHMEDGIANAATKEQLEEAIADIKSVAISRLDSITLSASAWVSEAESLHSQMVTIPGITEYSKVDLLPSVEQLAIFYNKSVSFVTENEDGVVTVYAIGDKPLLDYTMQVQITEVEA